MNLFSKYKTEVILFCIAFALRAGYAVFVQIVSGSHGFVSHADAELFYHLSAVNLIVHGVFSIAQTAPFYPDAYHTPLYSLFLAALMVLRTPLLGIVLIQSAMGAMISVFAFQIGQTLRIEKKISIAAAILVAIEPMSLYWGALLMSDTVFAFFLTLATLFLSRERPYASFAILGLATLTRPIALYLAPVFLCMLVYQDLSKKWTQTEIFKSALLSVVIIAVVISPWLVRNKIVFDVWSLTSAGWYEIYVAPLQEFAKEKGISVPDVFASIPPEEHIARFDFKYAPAYKAAFFSVVSHDPFGYFIVQMKRSLYSMVSNRYDYLMNVVLQSQAPGVYARISGPLLNVILLCGAVFWLIVYALYIFAVGERRLLPWWLFFGALFGLNILLSGAVNPGGADMSRYMLGLHAPLFLFAGVGLSMLAKFLGKRR